MRKPAAMESRKPWNFSFDELEATAGKPAALGLGSIWRSRIQCGSIDASQRTDDHTLTISQTPHRCRASLSRPLHHEFLSLSIGLLRPLGIVAPARGALDNTGFRNGGNDPIQRGRRRLHHGEQQGGK